MGENAKQEPPEIGEPKTKIQAPPAGHGVVVGQAAQLKPVPKGTYAIYRKMRENPTIALARVVATLPQRMAKVAFEPRDEDVPPERVEFIRSVMEPLWPQYINDAVRALDFGWTSWEKIFEVNAESRLVLKRLKYLVPEKTTVQVDEHGGFSGLKQGNVVLLPPNALVYSFDREGGNYYGRSQHENIRASAWWPWEQMSKKQLQYMTKVAGVIPMVHYPQGESHDANGKLVDNHVIAGALLASLGRAEGLAVPNIFASNADERFDAALLADINKLRTWHFDFLEATGQHGSEFDQALRHRESLMLRGWLVPERAVSEGQHGTKAEASEHGAIAASAAALNLQEIIDTANRWIVNQLLTLNYGPDAKNSVNIVREGFDPATKQFFRDLVVAIFGNPMNTDMFTTMAAVDVVLEAAGVPANTDGGEPMERPDKPVQDVDDIKAAVAAANAQANEEA